METAVLIIALRQSVALPQRSKQAGTVLIVALIVLVSMLMAGIAMFRSADTSLMIAGNLALRSGSVSASEQGSRSALSVIRNKQDTNGATVNLEQNYSTWYFASYGSGNDPTTDWNSAAFWSGANCLAQDSVGNTICFKIQRMCSSAGPSSESASGCLVYSAPSCTGSGTTTTDSLTADEAPAAICTGIYYRIMTRVVGPKGTTAITQAMALAS